MKSRRIAIAVFVAAVFLSPRRDVEACGPWFEPDVFVSNTRPDDLSAFANGQLGILQAGFDSNEYAVAYRYLNGGKLSAAESRLYAPSAEPPHILQDLRNLTTEQASAAEQAQRQANFNAQPAGVWLLTRAKYLPASVPAAQAPTFPTDFEGNIAFDPSYLNCPNPAFENASLTLDKRAGAWGKGSPWLADWIHAQDAVFNNCEGKITAAPGPAPPDSPALLVADRAYQTAAATLYAKQFDEAAKQFAAIALDANSPWKDWGNYLAARATVRKAFAMGKATDPYSGDLANFDSATMQRAQQMLAALLAQPDPVPSHAIVQDELNFIRIRTEPEKRAGEISAALAGPEPDANFAHDMQDLAWLLGKQIKIQDPPPLLAWIAAWRGGGTAASAFSAWQQNHALPWLVLALVKADPSDEFAPALLDAAAKIPSGSPAYDTAFFHRVRLLIGVGRADEARVLLDATLPTLRKQKPSSNLNALLGERMAVARSFNEFLDYAPRFALSTGSEGAEDLRAQCNKDAHATNEPADCPELKQPLEFDADAVAVFNRETPLRKLIEAVNSTGLPANLRRDLAVMAWTRSVMLQDAASAATLAPLLPNSLSQMSGTGVGFSTSLAILRNPGIRPYLEAGVSRVASYSYFDELRNNWWCKPWDNRDAVDSSRQAMQPVPTFMSAEDKTLADAEYQRLQKLPDSAALIGQRVIDYAVDHSEDPQVPEALALTVRATHYACQTWNPNAGSDSKSEYTPASKAAFELLHRRYPKSPWTLKTRYYY